MTTWTTRTVCVLLAVAPAAGADNGGMKEKMADKGGAVTLNPGDIKWGEAPPDVPKGAQLGVLHGDPTKTARSRCGSSSPTATRSRRTGTPSPSS